MEGGRSQEVGLKKICVRKLEELMELFIVQGEGPVSSLLTYVTTMKVEPFVHLFCTHPLCFNRSL